MKCKFCEIHKSGLGKKTIESESKEEVAFVSGEGFFISYVLDDYDSRIAFKINFCPMCGQSLDLNAHCPNCDKPFRKKRKDQQFCSKKCRGTHGMKRLRNEKKQNKEEAA